MTYAEIIERAVTAAKNVDPQSDADRLRIAAEALFPSVVVETAKMVADDLKHPWRSVLKDTTANIASGGEIPQTSTNSKEIIGKRGSVRDATDSKPLTNSFTLQEIRAMINNPGTVRKIPVYAYVIEEPRIYHTRTNVKIDVCVLDMVAVAAAIAADQVPLFPDAEGHYVTALTAKLLNPTVVFEKEAGDAPPKKTR